MAKPKVKRKPTNKVVLMWFGWSQDQINRLNIKLLEKWVRDVVIPARNRSIHGQTPTP
jgi:hypothetical protein